LIVESAVVATGFEENFSVFFLLIIIN
jgi:hypothetical protein